MTCFQSLHFSFPLWLIYSDVAGGHLKKITFILLASNKPNELSMHPWHLIRLMCDWPLWGFWPSGWLTTHLDGPQWIEVITPHSLQITHNYYPPPQLHTDSTSETQPCELWLKNCPVRAKYLGLKTFTVSEYRVSCANMDQTFGDQCTKLLKSLSRPLKHLFKHIALVGL